MSEQDRAVVAQQLGRPPRGMRAVAVRDSAGVPVVVQTSPRLPDGTPFPTLYYLTHPRLVALVSTLESEGVMREMTERLSSDSELAERYRRAHEQYLAERTAVAEQDGLAPLETDVTAGGMPGRVKCLHALLGHSLAVGLGVNPFGDETAAILRERWPQEPLVKELCS